MSSVAMPTRPSPRSERLGTPKIPVIRFTRGSSFEASLVRVCYGLSGCSPPWTDRTGFRRPPGAFTSRLPAGRSPFPPLDRTTTATGLLCWRDLSPAGMAASLAAPDPVGGGQRDRLRDRDGAPFHDGAGRRSAHGRRAWNPVGWPRVNWMAGASWSKLDHLKGPAVNSSVPPGVAGASPVGLPSV